MMAVRHRRNVGRLIKKRVRRGDVDETPRPIRVRTPSSVYVHPFRLVVSVNVNVCERDRVIFE